MRDLLPAEAEVQGLLGSSVLGTFDLYGYQQVSLPAFEYAEVLQRGLGAVDPTSLLRFVEPDTGEVVALRPDMTPQVARLVASRLSMWPAPARLSYRGSVLRRQHQRARHDQQMLQAGVELVGIGGVAADLEVITVCWKAIRSTGLGHCVLDLGHGGIANSLLAGVQEAARAELIESLNLKDGAELRRRAQRLKIPATVQVALSSLLLLQGGPEMFESARPVLEGTAAWPHVLELEALYEAIASTEMGSHVVIDLGEVRAAAYYTGPTFQILAEGPGQAVASGGRYDDLYGQFGAPRPAAGGAIQLDHLRWALGERKECTLRVVVESPANELLTLLREAGIPCVSSDPDTALDYARAWRYSHVVRASGAVSDSSAPAYRITRIVGELTADLGSVPRTQILQKLRP